MTVGSIQKLVQKMRVLGLVEASCQNTIQIQRQNRNKLEFVQSGKVLLKLVKMKETKELT